MNPKVEAKRDRAFRVNLLLWTIGECGRHFFKHNGRHAYFTVDDGGRIWLVDAYTQKRIYTHSKYGWRGFSNGGTLRSLCEALRDYIRTGVQMCGHLGPWPEHTCGGDLWGYGFDNMQDIRDRAEILGIRPRSDGGTPQ